MTDQFLILGIDPDASDAAIDEAFRYLSRNLNPTNFPTGSDSEHQAETCMGRIVPAYQNVRETGSRAQARQDAIAERAKPYNPDDMKPFLGHICVAAGIITLDDLNDAISKQSDIDLPLGQILQEKQLLSQTELDGLLMGQRLFGAPPRPLDSLTRRLMALGVVSRDMVKIALLDQRTNFVSTVPELIAKRGWVNEKIIKVLGDQMANQIA